MPGELSSFDVVPPEQVDRIVAWCGLKYPHPQSRDAAVGLLCQRHGIPAERGAWLVDQALARSQSWTRAHAEALSDEADGWERPVPLSAVPALPAFPVDAYPPWLRAEVLALSEFTQTPADLAATIVLSVLAAALGGRAVVEVRPG